MNNSRNMFRRFKRLTQNEIQSCILQGGFQGGGFYFIYY